MVASRCPERSPCGESPAVGTTRAYPGTYGLALLWDPNAHGAPVAKPLTGLGFCRFSPGHADYPESLPTGGGAAKALH
jgi:hypothetical protein